MPGFELIGDEERREIQQVLDSSVLMRYGFDGARNGQWKCRELEQQLAARFRIRHAHVCSSGTAALSTALAACGVGAGDEVILPPFTFVADLETVLFAGAVPVFAEIDHTLCLDPRSVAQAVTPKTKAVLVVHMCGAMAQIDTLMDVCERHNLALIEDAAQAAGATFRGRALGTFGKVGCLSFDYVKTITCGEGGAVLTNDDDLYRLAQAFTDHGHDHLGVDRGADHHPHIGLNFRLSELHAAVGVAQLARLDHILEVQRRHKSLLKEGLAGIRRLEFRHVPDPAGDSATFLSMLLPTEHDARLAAKALGAAGVDGCFYWYDNNWHYHRKWTHIKTFASPARLPIDRFGYGADLTKVALPQSDAVMSRTISMLIKLRWTPEQVRDRLARMKSALA
ncbi:MAG TPA: DegT/DnrJ/EryC1/StrS family aminotransferase [Nitrospiraceae bacterium]|jgi:8-amino-3,8-dideoxy-alpha-D-manno-octulosonate transaminase|nr:DegT/DnrJ/EryC1/StrS family aminotransferase [Nitrospiraceae bacterium]